MSYCILIADDDHDLRTIVIDLLNATGFKTLSAADGEETLRIVKQKPPDLLVLDLSMPKLNGWEVTKRLRLDPAFTHLPIIAFTAHALKGDEARALGAGCNGYVSKPFSPDALLAEIQRLLPSTPATPPL